MKHQLLEGRSKQVEKRKKKKKKKNCTWNIHRKANETNNLVIDGYFASFRDSNYIPEFIAIREELIHLCNNSEVEWKKKIQSVAYWPQKCLGFLPIFEYLLQKEAINAERLD